MEDLLKNMGCVAVVGASPSRRRASNRILRYLLQNDIKVIPVNPNYAEVEGLPCYSSIGSIPLETQIDIFDIFRNARYTTATVDEIVQWSQESGQTPAIWTQLGVSTTGAQTAAHDAGMEYISNRCLMVEHSILESD